MPSRVNRVETGGAAFFADRNTPNGQFSEVRNQVRPGLMTLGSAIEGPFSGTETFKGMVSLDYVGTRTASKHF